jgi:hypothetical protein
VVLQAWLLSMGAALQQSVRPGWQFCPAALACSTFWPSKLQATSAAGAAMVAELGASGSVTGVISWQLLLRDGAAELPQASSMLSSPGGSVTGGNLSSTTTAKHEIQ